MKTNGSKKQLLTAFFGLAIATGIGIFFISNKKDTQLITPAAPTNQPSTAQQIPTPTPVNNNLISIRPLSDTVVSMQDTVKLYVYIDSPDNVVSGYDIVLPFDGKTVAFQKAVSLHRDFQVFAHATQNTLSITGTTKISQNLYSKLGNQQVVEITFKPLSPGTVSFVPLFVVGKTDETNIIDDTGEDVLGNISGVSMTMGEKKQLPKAKPVALEAAISATYLAAEIPNEQCADCITQVTIEVEQNGVKKQLIFQEGGIDGQVFTPLSIFGVQIHLTKVSKNTAEIVVVSEKLE